MDRNLGRFFWITVQASESTGWRLFFKLDHLHSLSDSLAFLAGGCFETNLYDSEVVMVLYFIMALPFAGSPMKFR